MKKCEVCGRLMAGDVCNYCSLNQRMGRTPSTPSATGYSSPQTSVSSLKKCPTCGKVMVGTTCNYCAMMNRKNDFVSSMGKIELEVRKPRASQCINTCDNCGKRIIGNTCNYCHHNNTSSKVESKMAMASRSSLKSGPASLKSATPVKFESMSVPILASCSYQSVIVPGVDSKTELCSVYMNNAGPPTKIQFNVYLDGSKEAVSMLNIPSGESEVGASVSSNNIIDEYAKDHSVSIELNHESDLIYKDSFTLTVRPKYDIRYDEVEHNIARWVTSNAKAVKDLLVANGPIMSMMGEDASIFGYQQGVIGTMMQFIAVYEGLRSLNLKYVSDTESLGNSGQNMYQRVKTPTKVLEEGTGNCIELSCLFASCIEAMGLHPILIYPRGHAIGGVILTSPGLSNTIDEDIEAIKEMGLPIFVIQVKDVGDGVHRDNIIAMFVECTAMCGETDFAGAVNSAYNCISYDWDFIEEYERYSVIYYDRTFRNIMPMNE